MKALSFFVVGKPASQGSKRYVGKGIMIDSDKRLKPWRSDVREAAISAKPTNWNLDGPVIIRIQFIFLRPKSHYTRSGFLTKKAPQYPGRGAIDIDKGVRAILDALTSVAYHDDSQCVELHASKDYCSREGQPGAHIHIMPSNPPE